MAFTSRHSDRGRLTSSLEAIDTTVELLISEYRLDHPGAFAVKAFAGLVAEDLAHPSVHPAAPTGALTFAVARIRWDQHLHPAR